MVFTIGQWQRHCPILTHWHSQHHCSQPPQPSQPSQPSQSSSSLLSLSHTVDFVVVHSLFVELDSSCCSVLSHSIHWLLQGKWPFEYDVKYTWFITESWIVKGLFTFKFTHFLQSFELEGLLFWWFLILYRIR